jgi:hypothetical protein
LQDPAAAFLQRGRPAASRRMLREPISNTRNFWVITLVPSGCWPADLMAAEILLD